MTASLASCFLTATVTHSCGRHHRASSLSREHAPSELAEYIAHAHENVNNAPFVRAIWENIMERVRERFRQAERNGWFFPGAVPVKYPLSINSDPQSALTRKEQSYGEAAVLFLIGCKAESRQLQVLVTKRSTKVGSHAGEFCLPGGMYDRTVDKGPVDTALREAEEEVGLDGSHLEIVCTLPPFRSGWLHTTAVTPVVALLHLDIEKLKLCENDEVEYSLWVPLRHFIVGDYQKQLKGLWHTKPSLSNEFCFRDPETGLQCIIWGLTASICTAVSSIALGELPHFPSYCEVICKLDDKMAYTTELAPTSNIAKILLTSKL